MAAPALFDITDHDREVYEKHLRDFLPDKLIDIHTHVWNDDLKTHDPEAYSRVVSWPSLVAKDCSADDLAETYRLMFPGKEVVPLIFSSIKPGDDIDALNDYVAEGARKHGFPALLYTDPQWSPRELEERVEKGGFLGIKGYLNMAPAYLPRQEIRIYDFFPPHHLEVMDRHRWIVMLHIPRDGRLRDPVNLAQMVEMDSRFPNAQVIIAHVGRAYCPEDVGDAFDVLKETRNLVFDFSANTNAGVFEQLLRAFPARRVLFGSDLPILRMRMRRICEDGVYVNLVPPGLYGDVSGDKNMREVSEAEAEDLTFFMYQELLAFKEAAQRVDLSSGDLEDLFYNNAARVLRTAGFKTG